MKSVSTLVVSKRIYMNFSFFVYDFTICPPHMIENSSLAPYPIEIVHQLVKVYSFVKNIPVVRLLSLVFNPGAKWVLRI